MLVCVPVSLENIAKGWKWIIHINSLYEKQRTWLPACGDILISSGKTAKNTKQQDKDLFNS